MYDIVIEKNIYISEKKEMKKKKIEIRIIVWLDLKISYEYYVFHKKWAFLSTIALIVSIIALSGST